METVDQWEDKRTLFGEAKADQWDDETSLYG